MPKTKTHTDAVNIRISPTLSAMLNVLADRKGMNRAEFVRYLIQVEVDKEIIGK